MTTINTETIRNEVIVTMGGRDIPLPFDSVGVDMDSAEADIISAVRPIISESEGVDLSDEHGDVAFTVRKAINSNTIYVYPKPVAG